MSSEIIDAPKILLVDDEPLNRRLLAAILAPEGYSILESESGEEALKILADQGADLVLLDVMMPGIGGVETCRRIREQGDLDLPIVFVTARGDRESRIEGKAVGADDFLTKPVDETELLVRVETLLKLKAYHDLKTRHRQSLEEAVQARTKDLSMALQELRETETNLRRSHREAIERLSRASEFRDDETGWHIQRMSRYCEMLARFSGQSEEFCAQLRLASPMHDVGKIGTPDAILLKPGRHTEAETVVMREHSAIGHRILDGSNMKLLDLAAAIAYTHHEKWDGSGYPDGLAGEEIPIVGRIAAVADVFDALTSDRIYRPAFPMDKALEIMRNGRGSHFDPVLLDAFFAHLDEFLAVRTELLDPEQSPRG
ncbi:response regulator [bacterium]|nr:response regulator [bacterium]